MPTAYLIRSEVALDSSGNLYVPDTGNNRVLFYPSGSTTATRVWGQLGSFTTNTRTTAGSAPTAYITRKRLLWTASAISTWPTPGTIGCSPIRRRHSLTTSILRDILTSAAPPLVLYPSPGPGRLGERAIPKPMNLCPKRPVVFPRLMLAWDISLAQIRSSSASTPSTATFLPPCWTSGITSIAAQLAADLSASPALPD